MFHLAAYAGNKGAVVDDSVPGVVDPALSRSATSNLYIFQQKLQLLAGVAMSATMARCKLSSPTLRQINTFYLRPTIAAQIPASLAIVDWYGDQPVMLPSLEEVGPLITNTSAANEQTTVLIWIATSVDPVPPGQIIHARATSTTAAVANTWTTMSFTLEQSLPTGTYAIVGSEHISAHGIAHRVVFPNMIFRPGSLSHQSVNDIQDIRLLTRRLGSYGTFVNTAPPLVDVFCSAADASHEFYFQLVPIGLNVPMPV
jgi:hypothetical protein